MESDESENTDVEVKQSKNRTRLSLFLPPDVTIVDQTKTTTTDEEYTKKLNLEEESWKEIYNEQKKQKQHLLKELKTNKPTFIDYSSFNEKEIEYINAGPDMAKFVKKAEKLQKITKVFLANLEAEKQKYNINLKNIENVCVIMASIRED